MTGNGNLVVGDFAKAGYQSRALTEDEARLLNRDDHSHFLENHYRAVAMEDLQAVLNLYVTCPDSDIYQDFAKTIAGFRREQSKIISAYEPSIREAYNLAAQGAKPYEVVEQALHPELESMRKKSIPLESKSYARFYRKAVASETGHTIYGFLAVLNDVEEKRKKAGVDRASLYGHINQNLREYALDKCDIDEIYLHYAEGIYKHINAVRRDKSIQTNMEGKADNIVPFRRDGQRRKPVLTIVK